MVLIYAKIFHIIGVMCLFIGFGGLMAIGENRTIINKIVASLHGAGLLILLLSGFMIQGTMKIGFPGWLITKIILWLGMVALFVLVKREKLSAKAAVFISLAVGAIIAWLCLAKPF